MNNWKHFITHFWKYNWCDNCGYTRDKVDILHPINKEFPIFLCQNCINKIK